MSVASWQGRVDEGNAALARCSWAEARSCFEAALAGRETAEAQEGLSWAAWWLDDAETMFAARERAYPEVEVDCFDLDAYAAAAGFGSVQVLPVENDFWRFYCLRP